MSVVSFGSVVVSILHDQLYSSVQRAVEEVQEWKRDRLVPAHDITLSCSGPFGYISATLYSTLWLMYVSTSYSNYISQASFKLKEHAGLRVAVHLAYEDKGESSYRRAVHHIGP
jgi:hypothetical protein